MASLERQMELALARQAQSELEVFDLLVKQPRIPACHPLHALQMALEKLSKSFLWDESMRQRRPAGLETSHAVVKKALPRIFLQMAAESGFRPPTVAIAQVHDFARRIDELHPSVNPGGCPQNCKYPWEEPSSGSGTRVMAPVDFHFTIGDEVSMPQGVKILKLVRAKLRAILEN